MSHAALDRPSPATLADLLEAVEPLADIPRHRIRLHPMPGTATEADVLAALERDGRPCELIEGTLVEKAMGFAEAVLAGEILFLIKTFLRQHDLGVAAPGDGILRLTTGLIRIPDVSFVRWERLPDHRIPTEPIPTLQLDLAVEVLSESNTRAEMTRKVGEYFDAGTRLVWLIDPRTRSARVFNGPDRMVELDESGTLDGGDVLPGFALPLRELFAAAERGPDA